MSYSIQLPAAWVKEKYLEPLGLPEGHLNEIPVAGYAGGPGIENRWPMYEKAEVEKFLKNHPDHAPSRSLLKKEDFNVVDFASSQSLERIADCLEQLVGVLVPREPATNAEPADRIYNTEQAAKLLDRHPDVVRQYCRAGVLGCRDASGKWVIRHSEIERFRTGQLTVYGEGVP